MCAGAQALALNGSVIITAVTTSTSELPRDQCRLVVMREDLLTAPLLRHHHPGSTLDPHQRKSTCLKQTSLSLEPVFICSNVKRADNRRDIDFSHRSSGSSLFERSSASGAVSGSTSYDRSSGLGRRDAFFANSSTSSSAGRVVEPTRREPDPPRGAKDDR